MYFWENTNWKGKASKQFTQDCKIKYFKKNIQLLILSNSTTNKLKILIDIIFYHIPILTVESFINLRIHSQSQN